MTQLKADCMAFFLWLRVVRSPRACSNWRDFQAAQSFLLCCGSHLHITRLESFSQCMLGRGVEGAVGAVEVTGFGEPVQHAFVHGSPRS